MHADPHPGNILVRRFQGKPQLVLLDHGLYLTVSCSAERADQVGERKVQTRVLRALEINCIARSAKTC